ncbi:efflux RND transporter permease subunit [Catenovulum sediminis]|uniref:efflux RND transporter permease subunit n=1 Tax=Catenovulum sediminis TaxID=1740262 RepID=UPI00117DE275|nr:MMPL family transporter [Catenovulum sediminis]
MSKDTKMRALSWGICICFTILLAFLGWQAQYFEIDASADTLLVENNKHHIHTQIVDQKYATQEFILIAYKPKAKNIFEPASLQKILDISAQIKKIQRVKQVRSIVNVPIFTQANGISADVNSLTWENQQYDAQTLKLSLNSHPLYEGLLINEAQDALSMQVVFNTPEKLSKLQQQSVEIKKHLLDRELNTQEKQKLEQLQAQIERINKLLDKKRINEIEQIRAILKQFGQQDEFYLGGNNLLAYELINIIKSDLLIFGSAILSVVVFLLWYLFRQFSWVLLPVISCATSVLLTLGLLALFGLKVTVISANVIALQIILTLAMIIHIIVRYQEIVQREQASQQNFKHQTNQVVLVTETIKSKIKPCLFAGITTTIGFGTLILSSVQPVISFGWMMVLAMLVSFAVSLVFFPALLITFYSVKAHVEKHKLIENSMRGIAGLTQNSTRLLVVFTVLITLCIGIGSLKLTAENSFLNYFDESTDVRRELSYIDQQFGGSTSLDVIYKIPPSQIKENLILSAEAVQSVADIQDMLAQQSAMGNITSLADFTKIAQVVNGKPLTEYELTVLYKSLDKELRQDLFAAYFSKSDNEVRISTRIQDSKAGLDRGALLATIKQNLADLGISDEQYLLTGLFVLYQDILTKLVDSQITTLLVVYIAMALVLLLIFSSWKIALIALVPNIITTVIVMGIMGWLAIPLDLMTMTIATVAMGISMDDTIHYVHRYLQELKEHNDGNVIEATNLSVGYALVYTTTIIIIGFGMLVFSNFVPSMLFGLLTGIAMFVALITDITILPVMLTKFIRK